MLVGHRVALDPTPRQERALWAHVGAARLAYNWGLARVKANLDQRAAEKSYGISESELTPVLDWSFYSMRRDWNEVKDRVAPWWRECSKEAYSSGLDGLARALKNWRDSRKGKRSGGPVGFPRFRSRRRSRAAVRFTAGGFRCEARHAMVPKVGMVKLHEDRSGFAGLVQSGSARVLSMTVVHEHGRWFACFAVDTDVSRPAATEPDSIVGVDLGLKTLATLSTGDQIANPRHLSKSLRKVRRLARVTTRRLGPDRRAGRAPSNRWRRAAAALAKAQSHVGEQRRDAMHKATTSLVARYGVLVVEDLHVAAMLRNRSIARHVADASFAEFRRQVEYKAARRGGTVIVADRWFASSKTCSGCGTAKTKLSLSERTYVCMTCGLILDRDENAARNLAEYGRAHLAAGGAESLNGRGADRKTSLGAQVAVKRQPGAALAGQTGTVPTREGTAA